MQQLEVSSHSETLLGSLGDKHSKTLGCQQYRVNPDSVLRDQWGFPFPAGGTPPPCKSQGAFSTTQLALPESTYKQPAPKPQHPRGLEILTLAKLLSYSL